MESVPTTVQYSTLQYSSKERNKILYRLPREFCERENITNSNNNNSWLEYLLLLYCIRWRLPLNSYIQTAIDYRFESAAA